MGVFKSRKGSVISNDFMVVEGCGVLKNGIIYDVALYDDHLEFIGYRDSTQFEYSAIVAVCYERSSEVKYEQKSVLGRAAIGGLMFGGAGAVVGALSGLGAKPVTTSYDAMGISFLTDTGKQSVWLKDMGFRGKQLSEKLKELCFFSEK